MRVDITEHKTECLIDFSVAVDTDLSKEEFGIFRDLKARTFIDKKKREVPYFKVIHSETRIDIQADYYVGLDWLVQGKKFVYVAPKINPMLIRKFKKEADSREAEAAQEMPLVVEHPGPYEELNYLRMF